MSRSAEIAAFIGIARGNLPLETLAEVVRRRWPDATGPEIEEALSRANSAGLVDGDDRAAIEAVAHALLRRNRGRAAPPSPDEEAGGGS